MMGFQSADIEAGPKRFVIENWGPHGREDALDFQPLAGDGSDRCFIRVSQGPETAILVIGPNQAENRAYAAIGRHLWALDEAGPQFLAADVSAGLFLIEDLGSHHLIDLKQSLDPGRLEAAYGRVVDLLALVHDRGLEDFDPNWCFQTRAYDRDLILNAEAGYFLQAFVFGYLGMEADRAGLEPEFKTLAQKALAAGQEVLMHRDFQSRNIMIKNGRPRIIDFQGARLGPPGYDLASLLYDPYARLDRRLREALYQRYISKRRAPGFSPEPFARSYPFLAVCRLMQALGAFGFLTKVKKKPGFKSYIPAALSGLHKILGSNDFDFAPNLCRLADRIIEEAEK